MEFWLHAFPTPGRTADDAAAAQEAGFAGMLLADSTMLVADVWLELLLAARATTRLRLGPGVTNPVTRHPAATAAAAATLQVESGGRAELVVGRGDSAVLRLGLRPASTAVLDAALTTIDTCLHGPASPMGWYPPLAPAPVPISVAATGPATIALGARTTGRVDLTVGADPDRVAGGVATARAAAADPARVAVGAFVNVAVHPDPTVARDLVRGSAAIFAHFVSEGPPDAVAPRDREVVARLGAAYAEARHGLSTAAHATALPDDFLDRFTVAGTPAHCVRRLRELAALGLDRVVLVPGSRNADPAAMATSLRLLTDEVLPALR